MNKVYFDYLNSNIWAQIKIDLFELRGRKCEKCGSVKNICVHHLNYDNIFNEEPSDLIILCELCHSKEHGIIKIKKYKNSPKKKFIKLLTLSQKVDLKKRNPNQYKKYCKSIG